jgi:sugar-specific transcriptional regulator TrmB
VVKTLAGLGLTQTEAEVYVYLAKEGSQEAGKAAKSLGFNNRLISRVLDSLLEKEIVNKISEHEAIFSALPLDKAIDLLVKLNKEQTRILELNRVEIISEWKSLIKKDATDQNSNS